MRSERSHSSAELVGRRSRVTGAVPPTAHKARRRSGLASAGALKGKALLLKLAKLGIR